MMTTLLHFRTRTLLSNLLTAGGAVQSRTNKAINHLTLARQWGLAPDLALQTIDRTTQRGVRTCLYPSLLQWFSMNYRMLRYSHLSHNIFTNTMFPNIKAWNGNNCAPLFATNFGWVQVHSMKSEGDAHEALSLLFCCDGVPPSVIVDNSKE